MSDAQEIVENMDFYEKKVSDFLNEEHHFLIPSYQRGYRWDSKQVKDLLEDLCQFANDDNFDNKKYFLQPIVVKKVDKEWEVLDGQQRLTTMLLILKELLDKYVTEAKKSMLSPKLYTIKYKSRPELDFDNPNPTDNIDSYYLHNAKEIIKNWMKEKLEENEDYKLDEIIKCLSSANYKKLVYFIWYQVPENSDDESSIKVFNRLNKGKIPLTSSELIKALFIMDCNNKKDNKIHIYAKQHEEQLVMEWSEMERKFQDNKFWSFISNEEKQTRIDLLFDFVTEKKTQEDLDYSYRMFQNLFDYNVNPQNTELNQKWKDKEIKTMNQAWELVKKAYSTILSWYEDNIYYHYIGFLINQNERPREIYNYLEDEKRKSNNEWTEEDTEHSLRRKIREKFKIKNNQYLDESDIDGIEYGSDLVKKLLLLFNIETCIKTENQRFDFEKFKNESWDVEHIDSRNDTSLQEFNERITWMENVNKCLEIEIKANTPKKDEALAKKCSELIEKFKKAGQVETKTYSELYTEVNKHFGSSDGEDLNKDSINNLTLLNSSTNREYKDAPFMFKRQSIIEKDKEGKCFLPICTRNCFLKYYTKSDNDISQLDAMRWNNSDKQNYLSEIHKVLDPIFKHEDNEE